IYPFKTVEPGAIINSSIVWESRGARNLFGRLGVSGLANVDITPELAVRVAMAFATTLKKGSNVVTSRDSSRAARALKRAVMAGLNAAGVNVDDLEVAPVPTTRFQIRSARAQGGVTVRLVPGDPQSVVLQFFDADGIDISEGTQRKVERLFYREDFRRAFAADLGAVIAPGGERLTLIADEGRVLSNDQTLFCLLTLVTSTHEHARVALPVAVSRAAERIAQEAGAEIVWTKLSAPHLMETSASGDIVFAASQDGGYIFPAFLPAYDATA